jgi:outer membrane lipoprotein LolB
VRGLAVSALTGLLLLSGCQTVPQVPAYQARATDAHYEGRLAVRVENDPQRSFSASFVLEGSGQAGRLSLSTALGSQVAMARWLPGRVWLVDGDGTHEFDDMAELSRRTLGEEIPLEAFFDWLGGRPWPGQSSAPLSGSAPGFRQLGWDVRLDRFGDGLLVAQRLATPSVTLRAKLDPSPQP